MKSYLMVKRFIILMILHSCFRMAMMAQAAEKTTALSIELTPIASFYSTYKNWTRNNQLGFELTFRHYRPIAQNKQLAKRSFLLNMGIYYVSLIHI